MDEILLKRRYTELAERAYSQGKYTNTPFLNLAELDVLENISTSFQHIPYLLWGGAKACERKVAQFGSEELFGYACTPPIACVQISPVNKKFADDLTHRDFLGAIMNLGIERETLGDIRVSENSAYVFCLDHIAPIIISDLSRVKHTTVKCELIADVENQVAYNREPVTLQVASERLDAVISALYKLSRSDSQLLFQSGRIFVNDKNRTNGNSSPQAGDVVSVRGYGKFIYSGVQGSTRKGKHIITVERYV